MASNLKVNHTVTGEERQICQFQSTYWLEYGTPDSALSTLQFLQWVREKQADGVYHMSPAWEGKRKISARLMINKRKQQSVLGLRGHFLSRCLTSISRGCPQHGLCRGYRPHAVWWGGAPRVDGVRTLLIISCDEHILVMHRDMNALWALIHSAVCVCEYCGAPETVGDIHDSYRNISPFTFTCSMCYDTDVIQNYHNGERISSYKKHNNQTVMISLVHAFSTHKHRCINKICREYFNYK